METIKKWETFSIFLALGIIAAGSFLKSIPFALLIFGFGLLVQGYIIYLYKKNNLLQVYLKNKAGALIGGILLLAFFLLKDWI
jgi:predicted membrane protein